MNYKKGFKDVKIKAYNVNNVVESKVEYKVVNGSVIIDIKGIVSSVLTEQGISGFNPDRLKLTIPFSFNNQASGNSINVGINKKRYTLNLQKTEIIMSKQQKIDYDNTHSHRWKMPQWFKFVDALFYEAYGFYAIDLAPKKGDLQNGKKYNAMKSLIEKVLSITAFTTTHKSVVEYLRWAFSVKAKKVNMNLYLLSCDSFIQDWVIVKVRKLKQKGKVDGRKRKWD